MLDPERSTSSRRQKIILLIGLCLGVYCTFGLAWITLPGPEGDELLFIQTIPLYGKQMYVHASTRLLDWDIPLMAYSYVGALKSWLWYFLFLIWPPTMYSIRIPAVLLGGLALVLFYLWARRCYPPRTALLALALAAVDPSYIFTARLDWGPVLLSHVCLAGGLLLGTMWYQDAAQEQPLFSERKRFLLLAGAGFCFGLGLWDKATFVWFLAALGVSLLILFPASVLHFLRSRALVIFSAGLLLGAFPLIVFNMESGRRGTIEMVQLEPMRSEIWRGKITNLKLSLQGKAVFSAVGDGTDQTSGELPPGLANNILIFLASFNTLFGNLFLWLFCLGAALALVIPGHRRELLFPFLVCSLMWLQMMLAKNGGVSVHHYVLAYPLPQLGLAAVAYRVGANRRRWVQGIVTALLAATFLGQLSWDARYLEFFQQTGGRRHWTDATYEIADFVRERNPDLLVVMDWGFSVQLQLLTLGHVTMYEDFGGYHPEKLMELTREPNVLFLFHAKGLGTYTEGRQWLDEIAPTQGVTCRTVRNFFEREGRLVATMFNCESRLPSP